MSTFLSRVEDYVGTVADTTAVSDWLTAGAAYLIDRLPIEKFEKYTSDLTISSSGVSVKGMKVFRCHKAGYEAVRMPAGLKSQMADPDSIHYRYSTKPSYYIENGNIYVLPNGGTGIVLAYPTVLYSASSITQFPPDYDQAVVLYAAIQAAVQKYNLSIASLLALTLSTAEVIPTAPAVASFTYSDAALGTYSTTTIGTDEVVPTYTKPTFAGSFTDADTYIATDVDVEKAEVEIAQQNAILNQYQLDIQNEQNEFNKELQAYIQTINKQIEQARITQERVIRTADKTTDLNVINEAKTLEAAVTEYSMNLQRYSTQLEAYGVETNRAISKYSSDVNKYLQAMTANQQLITALKSEFQEYLK